MKKLILIVDDEARIARMFERRLKKAGYDIAVASNGVNGLRLAQELQPDLVLLDIHMPEMDGYEVIRTLRANQYTGIVAACSASVAVRDSDSTIEAGCDYFISKPVDITFEETITTILSA